MYILCHILWGCTVDCSYHTISVHTVLFTTRHRQNKDKSAAILQTIFWNAFSWMNSFVFWLKSHWYVFLTHWGRATHICVSKLTIIGSDNGLSPDRRQAIIWTNAGSLLIGPLGTNFSEILIEILKYSFKKMRLKVSSVKRRPFCLGLNVLRVELTITQHRFR